jgi:hypothetical protein
VTYQRAVLPPRTELRTRRKRVTVTAAVHAENLYERLKSTVLVEVTPPTDDPFHRVPDKCATSHSAPLICRPYGSER